MRIAISPRHRDAVADLDEKAEKMDVWVSCHRGASDWTVRVWRADPVTYVVSSVELRGEGPVEAVIAGALSDFAEKFPDERYTPEELIVIAHQSGIV